MDNVSDHYEGLEEEQKQGTAGDVKPVDGTSGAQWSWAPVVASQTVSDVEPTPQTHDS